MDEIHALIQRLETEISTQESVNQVYKNLQ